MKNNKNRIKDRPKSNPELREIKPKEFADAGITEGRTSDRQELGKAKNKNDSDIIF